jgi:hypothetical protein
VYVVRRDFIDPRKIVPIEYMHKLPCLEPVQKYVLDLVQRFQCLMGAAVAQRKSDGK